MTGPIQHHHGRVVDAPGDNVLAEFASVLDAINCVVEIQKELKTRNAEFPEHRKMEFRIGVNLGDVIEDGEQILGDRVNIAAIANNLLCLNFFIKTRDIDKIHTWDTPTGCKQVIEYYKLISTEHLDEIKRDFDNKNA
jgi:hypothetical protein